MTNASVPSTMVKCLYLFFDLPEMNNSVADKSKVDSEFTPKERRVLLQKVFVQVCKKNKITYYNYIDIKMR